MAKGSGGTKTVSAKIDPQIMQYLNGGATKEQALALDKKYDIDITDRSYSKETTKILDYYIMDSGASAIHDVIENGAKDSRAEEAIKVIEKSFKKLDQPLTVYRAVEPSKSDNRKSYTSTTFSPIVARDYYQHKGMEVRVYNLPKGTPVIKLGSISQEILIPRNFNLAKYRVFTSNKK